ncbi:hypothetical protein D3C87_1752210 [compost metagenome]
MVAKNKLRELIRVWQQEEKTTLLLTSHDLSDVEALCHRCILVDHGQKQYDGPLAGLKGDLSGVRRLQITVAESSTRAFEGDTRIRSLSSGKEFIHKYEMHTSQIPMTETISRLSQHYGEALQDLQILEVSLEEVLGARFTQRGAR